MSKEQLEKEISLSEEILRKKFEELKELEMELIKERMKVRNQLNVITVLTIINIIMNFIK